MHNKQDFSHVELNVNSAIEYKHDHILFIKLPNFHKILFPMTFFMDKNILKLHGWLIWSMFEVSKNHSNVKNLKA